MSETTYQHERRGTLEVRTAAGEVVGSAEWIRCGTMVHVVMPALEGGEVDLAVPDLIVPTEPSAGPLRAGSRATLTYVSMPGVYRGPGASPSPQA